MNSRFRRFPPASGIRAIFDRAKELESGGEKILHLEVGRPYWAPPAGTLELAKQALDEGYIHYIVNRGLPELRQAMAQQIKAACTRSFDLETELIITLGASEGVFVTASVLLGPGDEIIVPLPAWPHYQACAEIAGAATVPLNLKAETGFIIDPEELAAQITPHTRIIVVNSPSNPTGAVQPPEVLEAVAALALKHGIYVLSDEVYSDFVYQGTHRSIGEFMGGSDLFIYTTSLSKSLALTGWRIGCLAASRELSDAMNRIHQYTTVCGVACTQRAAAMVLQRGGLESYHREMREAFNERGQVWRQGLAALEQVFLAPPSGAFYLFPRIDLPGMDGQKFCHRLLEEYHLAMVPGEAFGEAYANHVRISYGGELALQQEAAARFGEAIKQMAG